MARPVVMIIAAGPGVSGSLGAAHGPRGLRPRPGRSRGGALQTLGGELEALGATVSHAVADVTDAAAATDAVRRLAEGHGRVDWLHFNPSCLPPEGPALAHRRRAGARRRRSASARC